MTKPNGDPAGESWKRAAATSDVVPERPYGVSASGVELVLVRTGSGLHAYEGRCPHQGALLAEGELDKGVLVCRNHGWRFDAETGRRIGGSECLRPCPVREDGGSIFADVSTGASNGASSGKSLRRLKDLPGPRGVPVLGNLMQVDFKKFNTCLEAWAAEHGKMYKLRLGPQRMMVVADRALADQALRARPETFRRIHTFESVATEMGIVGPFTAEGATWRPLRRLAMDALSNRNLRGFYPIVQTVAERMTRRWQRVAAAGETVDIAEEFKRLTVDTTTWLALGRDVNTADGKGDVIEQHLGLIFPMLHKRVVAAVPYWRLFRLPSDRRFERALAEVRAWIDEVIAETRARMAADPARALSPSNFLEAMLTEHDENGQPFSDDALFGSAMTMIIAGQDSTSASLAWTVHHLCQNPAALARMRAELDAVLGDSPVPVGVEAAQRLPYTGAVVSESMRLTPVVPILYLETNEDTVVGDVAVTRGTPVLVLTRPTMRDAQFGAATEFRPERWLDDERGPIAHDPAAHIPFGSGPRLCPGRSLATLEARVALAALFHSFDVEGVGAAVTESYTSIMVPSGVSVRLRARSRAADRVSVPELASAPARV